MEEEQKEQKVKLDSQDASLTTVDEHLGFDLLQEWVSTTLRRRVVADTSCRGCSWKVLAQAVQYARKRTKWPPGLQDDLAEPEPGELQAEEQHLRHLLVASYGKLKGSNLRKVLQAKVRLNEVFNKITSYRGVPAAKKLWPWYLLCLLNGCNEKAHGEATYVHFTLDVVDLEFLADLVGMEVHISRLLTEPVELLPRRMGQEEPLHVILLQHESLWGAVLGPRVPCMEEQASLVGSLVEMESDLALAPVKPPAPLKKGLRPPEPLPLHPMEQVGTVLFHDDEINAFLVSLGRREVLAKYSHLKQVIYRGDTKPGEDENGSAKITVDALDEIVPGSLDWHLFTLLVRTQAGTKLNKMMAAVAGRGQNLESGAVPKPEGKLDPLMEITEDKPPQAVTKLREGRPLARVRYRLPATFLDMSNGRAGLVPWDILVAAVACWQPDGPGQLAVRKGEELLVLATSRHWVLVARSEKNRHDPTMIGWCPRAVITVWSARCDCPTLLPGGRDGETTNFVLEKGNDFLLQQRLQGKWKGWAAMKRWGGRKGRGLIPLSYMNEQLLVVAMDFAL